MSLTYRTDGILLGASPAFMAGIPELVSEDPQITETGWDTLTQIWAVRRASLTAEELAVSYPAGTRLGTRNWWLSAAKPGQRFPGLHLFELTYKGWAGSKPVKIDWSTAADSQNAENIAVVEGGVTSYYARVSTLESAPAFTASYLVYPVSSSTVPSLSVGRPATRTGGPAVPDTVWDYLTRFTYHWPNGWVLMDLAVDLLPGTAAGLARESYRYIRSKTP